MYVITNSKERKANYNKMLAKLFMQLKEQGIKFSREQWQELLAGEITDFRFYHFVAWAEVNDPHIFDHLMSTLETVYSDTPLLEGIDEYEKAFQEADFYSASVRIMADGTPFIN